MRPGLTGPMQVHGRGELTFQERLAVEREYVENYSLRKDLRILLRTAGAIFRAERRVLMGAGTPVRDPRPADRVVTARAVTELPLDELELPLRAHRREVVGRLALIGADMIAVAWSMLVVAVLSGARVTLWVLVLLPFYALLAKMARLYDRDQFVLHKTTLDEAPALVAVAAISVLVIEGVQALEFRAAPTRSCFGQCSGGAGRAPRRGPLPHGARDRRRARAGHRRHRGHHSRQAASSTPIQA